MIEECFAEVEPLIGTKAACRAVGRPRATHYRKLKPGRVTPPKPRPAPVNKLTDAEVAAVLDVLNSDRFCDCSPAQVYFTLLDEGDYLASESTFYRVLRSHGEIRERRRQATHPPKVRPELIAAGPLVVWSWDITKLKGPRRGEYYSLYVVMDIFSRYVVTWCVAPSESGDLAKELIADAVARNGIGPDQLTIHADRGSPMTSKPVCELLIFLGITRSHSRPHVSNDNPYSEAGFKTLKYCPASPSASARSRTHGRSVPASSATTTTSTDIRASPTTRPRRSTSGRLPRSGPSEHRPLLGPTRPTRSASGTFDRNHPIYRRSRGSTSPYPRRCPRRTLPNECVSKCLTGSGRRPRTLGPTPRRASVHELCRPAVEPEGVIRLEFDDGHLVRITDEWPNFESYTIGCGSRTLIVVLTELAINFWRGIPRVPVRAAPMNRRSGILLCQVDASLRGHPIPKPNSGVARFH